MAQNLTYLPLPEMGLCWLKDEAGRSFQYLASRANLNREMLATGTSWEGSVLRWVSNGAVVPVDCFRDALVVPPVGQAVAEQREAQAAIAAYRARQPRRPSVEERDEARAAFGAGVKVVDVLTGRTFWT